jgi:N-acyl-D-amino-acid deacylase
MILIKSVQIIDGTGKAPYRSDVLIKNDRISAIGNFPGKQAETVIDGLGLYLTPGFIDLQSSADHYLSLFTNPSLDDFLSQGVTTIFGGHCGSSLAPLIYGTLESIQKWADPNSINVGWHSVHEFLEIVKRYKLGVNFGTLVGHSTIRRALIGEDIRELTPAEINVFKHLLRESLHEGAFGFSTGLGYVHSGQATFNEIKELVTVVKDEKGIYTTHLRDERDKIVQAVKEVIEVAKETGVETLISHFRPIMGYENNYSDALKLIEDSSRELRLHFNNYPYDTSIVPIYTLLPSWAQAGGAKVMMAELETPKTRERIIKELSHINGEEIVISKVAGSIGFDYLVGKSVSEFAKNQEVGAPEALVRLMLLTKLRTVVFVKNINLELTIQSLAGPASLVTANSAGLRGHGHALKHKRFTSTFPRFLEISETTDGITLETAVEKITRKPAEKIGLKERGVIKEGNFADLALFSRSKDKEIVIEHTFINGVQAVKDQALTGALGGKVLKRK